MEIVKDLNNSSSIPDAFFRLVAEYPGRIAYSQLKLEGSDSGVKPQDRPRSITKRTYGEVAERIKKIAAYLVSIGFKAGDKAAIISNSRCEWIEADMAILSAGGVTISVYSSLLPQDIAYVLYDSQAKIVFIENEEQTLKIKEITEKESTIPETEGRPSQKIKVQIEKCISFEKCSQISCTSFEEILSTESSGIELAYIKIQRDDLASLVYTSGTTGPPKGVIQTHGNHLSNVRQAFEARLFREDSKIMIVLPLAHSFAKLMGYICTLTPAESLFPAVTDKKSSKLNPDSLTKDISICGATIFPLVPRMLEKMKEGIEKKAAKNNFLGFLIRRTIVSKHPLYKPIRNIIRKKLFGTNFVSAISGGAKLPQNVAQFFNDISIEVLEGYGLTETCVATNVNRFGAKKLGTVGPVLASDIEMTLSEEGEILYRGPNISKGYFNRPEATKAAWDSEGRFHTGDLGAIDNDGYLSITGRKKELIVTAGGKKVAPENIENKIKAIPLVSQAVMVGEGKPYCAALLTVNTHDAKKLLDPAGKMAEGEFNKKLHDHIWKEVEVLNTTLASFESIKKIEILKEDFTIENGMLTPTMKVKRNEVTKRFKDLVEKLYAAKD